MFDGLKTTKLPAYSETLSIEGMTCASCVGRVEKALKKVENVEIANVNLATEKAVVYSNQPIQREALVKAVERAGYDVPKAAPVELSIEGMTCASCVARVEKALKSRRCSRGNCQLSNRAGLGTSRCISQC